MHSGTANRAMKGYQVLIEDYSNRLFSVQSSVYFFVVENGFQNIT